MIMCVAWTWSISYLTYLKLLYVFILRNFMISLISFQLSSILFRDWSPPMSSITNENKIVDQILIMFFMSENSVGRTFDCFKNFTDHLQFSGKKQIDLRLLLRLRKFKVILSIQGGNPESSAFVFKAFAL